MDVHVHVTGPVTIRHSEDQASRVEHMLTRVLEQLAGLRTQAARIELREAIMALDLTELETAVTENTAVDASAVALIEGIAGQLDTLAAELADQPAAQAAVSAKAQEIRDSSAGLAAAVAANTPAAPVDPNAPPVDPNAPPVDPNA